MLRPLLEAILQMAALLFLTGFGLSVMFKKHRAYLNWWKHLFLAAGKWVWRHLRRPVLWAASFLLLVMLFVCVLDALF